ncbi:MAG: phosphoenolpyruvate mutase [Clostridiales bacterium]|nr:phosphoenolpyruvate mutase [Clostridiales bacterium]
MSKVYTLFCTDVIHEGHLNIIENAKKLGDLTVGVLSDDAMIRYNRFPTLSLQGRIDLVKGIEGVSEVIVQKSVMYDEIFETLRPDYVVHGDNWDDAAMNVIKANILKNIEKYGGELIEIPYTYNANVSKIDEKMQEKLALADFRRARLRKVLAMRDVVKIMQVHSGLTGLIVEKTVIADEDNIDQFDGMWLSSLCDSTDRGKPDIELVDMTSRLRTVGEVLDVTTKPIIIDGDTGGLIEHFVYNVRTLERLGVSAVIIEDKTGLKKNSLFGTEVEQTQDTVENFCRKISAGKAVQRSDDFMIIARCESLILEKGIEDALARCRAYVEAGADGIMIHSRKKDPKEIFDFCDEFRKTDKTTPIVVVPTAFNEVTTEELASHGINIIIYANQLLRAAYPAMTRVAESILRNHRSAEIEDDIIPFKDIIRIIDEL